MALEDRQRDISEFCDSRDWRPFHTPKNLAMALAGEVGELMSVLQWMTPEESQGAMADQRTASALKDEIADVAIYTMRLAEILHIDLDEAISRKLALNAEKYPPEASRGNATKYTQLATD